MAKGRWIALGAVTTLLVAPGAAHAASARVSLSFAGSDVSTWSVARGEKCQRYGSGGQTVQFGTARPVVVTLGEARVARTPILTFRRQGRRAARFLVLPLRGTVTRTDRTTFAPPAPDGFPCPERPKDCRTTALGDGGEGDENPGPPDFSLTGPRRRFLAFGLSYWDSRDGPWTNCLGFQTPVGTREDGGPIWRGPEFGDVLLEPGDNGEPAYRAPLVFPGRLRPGRTYRFTAGVRYGLSVPSGRFPRHVFEENGIFDEGGYGGIVLVGSPIVVEHKVSWTVVVRRLG
jgi:hypothetical protein